MSDPKSKEEQVSVPKSVLERMEERMEKQDEQIELLTKAASKARLARFAPKEKIGQSIKVGTYTKDGEDTPLLVVGWGRLLKDEVRLGRGIDKEEQLMEFELENGDKIKMDYKDFHDAIKRVKVDIDPEKTTYNADKSPRDYYFIWNGKGRSINATFINP